MDKDKKQKENPDVLITEEKDGAPLIEIDEGPTEPEERVQFGDQDESGKE